MQPSPRSPAAVGFAATSVPVSGVVGVVKSPAAVSKRDVPEVTGTLMKWPTEEAPAVSARSADPGDPTV